MPRPIRHPLRVAAIAASLALLGACTGPSSGTGSAPSAGDSPKPSASASAAADKQDQSPLQVALWSHLGGSPQQDDATAQQQQVEEAKAACMSQQGFQYIPEPVSPQNPTTAAADGVDTESREFAVQYGYGVSFPNYGGGTDAPSAAPDPNKAITDAMSASEKTAYLTALFGSAKTHGAAPAGANPEGCNGVANDQVYGKRQQFNQSEEMVALQAGIDQIESDFGNDPKITALNSSWASCMADAGFGSYAKPDDALNDFVNRMSPYFAALRNGSSPKPKIDPAIQDAERRTATADWDCKNRLHYQDAATQVHYGLERQFVSAHKTEIDAVIAAYAAAGL